MNEYKIIEDKLDFTTVEAESAEKALEIVDAPWASDYARESTVWITWYAVNVDDEDDTDSRTFTVDPEGPSCLEDRAHAWNDYEPAIGSGGGVKYSERCKHCRAVKHTDTWAQNPENGVQGLTSIRYETDEPVEDES